MNKFIKLTQMGSNHPIYFNVGNITRIEVNQYDEVKIYTSDNDFNYVNESIEEVMNLINN